MIQNRKERFRRKVGFTNAEITAIPNPIKNDRETLGSTVSENDISDKDFQGGRIVHNWFDMNDLRQKYVNYAYKLWGWDLVYLMECENGNWSIYTKGDSGKSTGLCQIHKWYHKDIPQDFYTTWQVQVEYCYQKRKSGTVFYWPSRMIKGKRCSEYVKDRFTYIE